MYKIIKILTAIGGVVFFVFMIKFNANETSVLEWLIYIPVIVIVLCITFFSISDKGE